MGNCWVRLSSSTQLFLLDHYNCFTRLFLHILYAIDAVAYTVFGPLNFLQRRSDIYGPTYAALGRLIVGDYDKCVELIESPQQRGHFLGRAKLIKRRVPDNLLIFLSDEGDDGLHAKLHNYLWTTLVPPAYERITTGPEADIFSGYVASAAKELMAEYDAKPNSKPGKEVTKPIICKMVISYVYHAMFGVALTASQLEDFYALFFSSSPGTDYVMGALRPFATPFGCFCCKRESLVRSFTQLVLDSPMMADYVPSPEVNGNLSKEDFAESLFVLVGVAGAIGTSQLCTNVLNSIPSDYEIDTNNKMDVMCAVLEAARIKAPVNNVNILLKEPTSFKVKNKDYTFVEGTPVAASIGLASVDGAKFENPNVYNPKRHNLMSATINFNHVGYSEVGSGRRQCPGRNIAVKIASDFLIALRNDSFDDTLDVN